MTLNFSEFDLQPQLVQTIADIGYAAPTPIQSTVIPAMPMAFASIMSWARYPIGVTSPVVRWAKSAFRSNTPW